MTTGKRTKGLSFLSLSLQIACCYSICLETPGPPRPPRFPLLWVLWCFPADWKETAANISRQERPKYFCVCVVPSEILTQSSLPMLQHPTENNDRCAKHSRSIISEIPSPHLYLFRIFNVGSAPRRILATSEINHFHGIRVNYPPLQFHGLQHFNLFLVVFMTRVDLSSCFCNAQWQSSIMAYCLPRASSSGSRVIYSEGGGADKLKSHDNEKQMWLRGC